MDKTELINDLFTSNTQSWFIQKWNNHPNLSIHINEIHYFWLPITSAASQGLNEVIIFLIENGADVNKQDECSETALSESVRTDRIDIIKILLKNGADIKLYNYCAIKKAFRYGRYNIIEYLIDDNIIDIDTMISLSNYASRHLEIKRLIRITMIFADLPQYIILWITDWLDGSNCLTEYEKIRIIERTQKRIYKLKN